MFDRPERTHTSHLSVRGTGVGRFARSTPRGWKSTDTAIPCSPGTGHPFHFHLPAPETPWWACGGRHAVAPARGHSAAPCRVEGRRGECEEALSPDRPSSAGNPIAARLCAANTTSSHGRTCSHDAHKPATLTCALITLVAVRRTRSSMAGDSVAAATTDDGPFGWPSRRRLRCGA